MYSFDRQATVSRSARDMRSVKVPSSRSKTPGPEFYSTTSTAQYAHTMKARSKTPTAYELSSNNLPNRFDSNFYEQFISFNFILVDHYNLFILNILN